MENIRYKQFILFKIMVLVLLINLPLSANTSVQEVPQISSYDKTSMVQINIQEDQREDSLGSLGFIGALILIVLTSIIGAYLLRDEFTKL
jgi:hypothetical protein